MKDIVAETDYGGRTPTMWERANHASQFDSRSAVINGAINKVKNVSSISNVRSEKAVRKREKPLTSHRNEEEKGGGGGRRGGARRSVKTGPTVHAVQCSEPEVKHWKYKQWSLQECLTHFAAKVPPGTMQNRCMGCLSKGHKWDGSFASCISKKCPFCGVPFFGRNGHAAPECPKCPANKNAIALAIEKRA